MAKLECWAVNLLDVHSKVPNMKGTGQQAFCSHYYKV
jgi:hypothetical protein